MEITLAGGLVVDLASRDDLAQHHQRLERLLGERRPEGRYYRITGSVVTTAGFSGSGPIALPFTPSAPPAGRHWFVEWIAVWSGGTNAAPVQPASGAVANLFAALMIGRSPQGPGGQATGALSGATSWGDVVMPGLTVPTSQSVPDKTMVKALDQLYILLAGSGLAASTNYLATAGVVDTEDLDESYFW